MAQTGVRKRVTSAKQERADGEWLDKDVNGSPTGRSRPSSTKFSHAASTAKDGSNDPAVDSTPGRLEPGSHWLTRIVLLRFVSFIYCMFASYSYSMYS